MSTAPRQFLGHGIATAGTVPAYAPDRLNPVQKKCVDMATVRDYRLSMANGNTTMKQHKDKQVQRQGYVKVTTLCGRLNAGSRDGMNIANTDAEVTCKFCLKLMAAKQSA
jgi:hypothetical protein